jgi:DNA polymerase-3 subunit alpha
MEIAERCQFEFPFGKPQFPDFHPPDGSTAREFLHRLVMDGLQGRYREQAARFSPQVQEELRIIAAVGYEAYFLVTWEILQDCRARGIEWITRGSAADSMVCYCLGISDVCPVRFDLYFKRFLNPERMALNKLPDIDIDFAHDRKDDVVQLIFARYGRERCAVVGGFSTFQARSAFAEVAKVLGVAEREVRKFTEHFPWGFGGGWVPDEPAPTGGARLLELLRANPETRGLPLDEEPYQTAVELAEFLDGRPRYPKMHPCGVVLSCQPMRELTPTFISNKGLPTTHYDMDAVETIGLVKMDILAQGGLAVMRDATASLAKRGVTVDLRALEPWEDSKVWDMIAGGGARAVHHIESPAMTSLNRMTNVREIDGLIAIVSVIRPGAANESKKLSFTRRYQGMEPVTYPHPSLEQCLRSTYGLVVYEEHILQICEAFAGLPAGRADVLRRALVKQKRALVAEIGREFTAAARRRGHDDAKIAEVWQLVSGFSGYAFNKAHSTAYGVEAYQAAWLKRYYPAEFMAGVLTHGKGFYHPLVYVLECHRLGLQLLPPSLREPGPAFVPHGLSIRVPVTHVKGLTARTVERLLAEHERSPFVSLADFVERVRPAGEEAEAMLRAGAFDEFGATRTRLFWDVQHLLKAFSSSEAPDQGWLIPPPGLEQLPRLALDEPTRQQRLLWETELFGYAVSGHPLELFDDVAWETYCPVNRLGEFVGQIVTTCGLVVEQRIHHQITGEPMKFLTLADWTGMMETELFAATYRSYGLATVRYPVLEIKARVEPYDNRRGFSLRVLSAGKPRAVGGRR